MVFIILVCPFLYTDKVLHGKDIYRNEYKKALILLEDMKSKYKMIHLKSMEQAAQIESNYRTKGQ